MTIPHCPMHMNESNYISLSHEVAHDVALASYFHYPTDDKNVHEGGGSSNLEAHPRTRLLTMLLAKSSTHHSQQISD